MSAPLTLFQWFIPEGGVRYVPDAQRFEAGTWRPVGEALIPQGARRRRYSPLDEPSPLFEALATVDATSGESLAAFASEWGLLGVGNLVTSPTGQPGRGTLTPLERVADWRREVLELRDVFDLWSAASVANNRERARDERAQAAESLESRVEVRDGFALFDSEHTGRGLRVGGPGTEVEALLRGADVRLAARLVLRKLVDDKLDKLTKLRLVYDKGDDALRLRAGPKGLLGAAWLQLAEAAGGERKARRCPRCAKWFVVKSGRRGHDEYCSPACRQSFQRLRTRAYVLADEGKKAPTIARTVGVSPRIVREWLDRRK